MRSLLRSVCVALTLLCLQPGYVFAAPACVRVMKAEIDKSDESAEMFAKMDDAQILKMAKLLEGIESGPDLNATEILEIRRYAREKLATALDFEKELQKLEAHATTTDDHPKLLKDYKHLLSQRLYVARDARQKVPSGSRFDDCQRRIADAWRHRILAEILTSYTESGWEQARNQAELGWNQMEAEGASRKENAILRDVSQLSDMTREEVAQLAEALVNKESRQSDHVPAAFTKYVDVLAAIERIQQELASTDLMLKHTCKQDLKQLLDFAAESETQLKNNREGIQYVRTQLAMKAFLQGYAQEASEFLSDDRTQNDKSHYQAALADLRALLLQNGELKTTVGKTFAEHDSPKSSPESSPESSPDDAKPPLAVTLLLQPEDVERWKPPKPAAESNQPDSLAALADRAKQQLRGAVDAASVSVITSQAKTVQNIASTVYQFTADHSGGSDGSGGGGGGGGEIPEELAEATYSQVKSALKKLIKDLKAALEQHPDNPDIELALENAEALLTKVKIFTVK